MCNKKYTSFLISLTHKKLHVNSDAEYTYDCRYERIRKSHILIVQVEFLRFFNNQKWHWLLGTQFCAALYWEMINTLYLQMLWCPFIKKLINLCLGSEVYNSTTFLNYCQGKKTILRKISIWDTLFVLPNFRNHSNYSPSRFYFIESFTTTIILTTCAVSNWMWQSSTLSFWKSTLTSSRFFQIVMFINLIYVSITWLSTCKHRSTLLLIKFSELQFNNSSTLEHPAYFPFCAYNAITF